MRISSFLAIGEGSECLRMWPRGFTDGHEGTFLGRYVLLRPILWRYGRTHDHGSTLLGEYVP